MECNLHSYDKYIVSFSGGKDSTACFLYLLDNGIPLDKIELWHQDIDGREDTFFDWEVTPDYCRRFAEAFGVQIYYQWKEGGFRRELMRENSLTAPNCFECPDGTVGKVGGKRGKLATRRKFPQCSPDLTVRWCSGYLKIDVCSAAIINQPRFRGIRTLVLSGERGEESAARAKYPVFEPDRAVGNSSPATWTACVPSGIGKNNKSGTSSKDIEFAYIRAITWAGAAVPANSAYSVIKTSSPVQPPSVPYK